MRHHKGLHRLVKFDGAKVRRYRADKSSSPMNPLLFLCAVPGVVAKLRGAKQLIVEVDTFTSGAAQFEFDVGGLAWSLYKGPVVDN